MDNCAGNTTTLLVASGVPLTRDVRELQAIKVILLFICLLLVNVLVVVGNRLLIAEKNRTSSYIFISHDPVDGWS